MNIVKSRDLVFVLLIALSFIVAGPAFSTSYDQNVYEAQRALQLKGFDAGTPDGLFGKRTARAIRAFQKNESLPVTGKLDSSTRAALGIAERATAGGSFVSRSNIGGGAYSYDSKGQLRYEADVQGDVLAFDPTTGGFVKLTSGMTKKTVESAARTGRVTIKKRAENEWVVGNQTVVFKGGKFTTIKNH